MKNLFKDWSLFEKLWILTFTSVNVYLFFAWDDTLLGFISSLSGMICVVLVAKGKISNYYFGIVQASTYAYISYTYGLYGEAMLNGLFYFPLQFVGLYMWNKNKIKNRHSVQGEDVPVKRLDMRQWIAIISLVMVGIVGYGLLLNALSGNNVWIDSTTNILSVAAMLLMLKRFAEQWLFWIAVNVFSILLWVLALTRTGAEDTTILVMWIAFLINSIYGYVNWIKMDKRQEVKSYKI